MKNPLLFAAAGYGLLSFVPLTAIAQPSIVVHQTETPPTLPPTSAAAIDPEKEKSIRHLIEVTGAVQLSMQTMLQMITLQRKANPSIPTEFWDRFQAKISEKEIADLVIPVYDRRFSKEEIDGLIAFYETPLGKKVITAMPQVIQESSAAGEVMGRKIAEEVVQEMRKDGKMPGQTAPAPKPKPAAPKPKVKAK